MEEQQVDIDNLLSDAGDYIETRTTLWKLKAIESLSDVSGELVSGLGMIVISSFVIIIFSIGISLLIGDWVGKSYYGFFICRRYLYHDRTYFICAAWPMAEGTF